eukprot:14774202-Alexandrium_andersonii.AAC.1
MCIRDRLLPPWTPPATMSCSPQACVQLIDPVFACDSIEPNRRGMGGWAVSYTHLRAHETSAHL